jgi:hypothetical protein
MESYMTTPPRFRVRAYAPVVRVLVAALLVAAAVNLLHVSLLLAADHLAPAALERLPPPDLFRRLLWCSLVPFTAALLVRVLASATVEIGPAAILLRLIHARYEIPLASIVRVEPWRLPLPAPGLELRLRSGRRFHLALSLADPTPLVRLLPGGDPAHPAVRAAAARHAARWLRHPAWRLGLVPLLPTLLLFRVQQLIVAGGFFGELHRFGLQRWLYTLSGVWMYVFARLLAYAVFWRVAIELAALPARGSRRLRLGLELVGAVGYVGGVIAAVVAGLRG